MRLAIGDVNETGDVASQVQQGVQLDDRLGRAKRGPGKHRQAQVDGAGVERVDRSVEFQSKRLLGLQGSRPVVVKTVDAKNLMLKQFIGVNGFVCQMSPG